MTLTAIHPGEHLAGCPKSRGFRDLGVGRRPVGSFITDFPSHPQTS